ncbi:hypothetical protein PR048_024825 [Dryococelus australis]|uniref:Ig-like domain-containing protein n=1 Tax=Dryococelus australis TaxID=614101 RepID=A0ABQ9GPM1_9NEOP|nr:hypothetical protein PR048_024825 [Dryococelus australis]
MEKTSNNFDLNKTSIDMINIFKQMYYPNEPDYSVRVLRLSIITRRRVERFGRLLTSRSCENDECSEVSMAQRRIARVGETGHPRVNPPTSGVLPARFPSKPRPAVSWYRNDELQSAREEVVAAGDKVRSELVVRGLGREDLHSQLKCVARNNNRTQPLEATVHVDMNFETRRQGEGISLHWRASNRPLVSAVASILIGLESTRSREVEAETRKRNGARPLQLIGSLNFRSGITPFARLGENTRILALPDTDNWQSWAGRKRTRYEVREDCRGEK